jgi:peptidoglycan/LPS O-acetylase OafA/YrhL
MSDPNQPSPNSSPDWRAERRAERHARHEARGPVGGAIAGLVLLVIGAVLLADNFGYHLPEHWWAALLLIPAAGSLVSAARFWREDSRMSARVTGSLAGGLIFLVLACAFFFGVDWNFLWPAVLMLIGAGLMARSYWPK